MTEIATACEVLRGAVTYPARLRRARLRVAAVAVAALALIHVAVFVVAALPVW